MLASPDAEADPPKIIEETDTWAFLVKELGMKVAKLSYAGFSISLSSIATAYLSGLMLARHVRA